MTGFLDGFLADRAWWRSWRGGHWEKWWATSTTTYCWFRVQLCYHYTHERPEGFDVCLRCEENW